MLVVQNLSKKYKDNLGVKEVSFEVKKGTTTVLLGTSGSGKTTTLKMVNQLIPSNSGKVFLNGKDTSTIPKETLRRGIGYVSQNNGLFPHRTVAENIAIVPTLLQWSNKEIQYKSKQILEQLLLPYDSFAHKYPSELSGGQQQRVSIARAVIAEPPLILMDEPFGALDPISRFEIREEIVTLFKETNKTLLLVTHDVKEAIAMGDQIILMDQGRIAQTGTGKTILFNPINEFVKNFFDHERFQLEMMVIKIIDILPHLKDTQDDSNIQPTHLSLWDILNQMEKYGYKNTTFRTDQNKLKAITPQIIFELLAKEKAKHG